MEGSRRARASVGPSSFPEQENPTAHILRPRSYSIAGSRVLSPKSKARRSLQPRKSILKQHVPIPSSLEDPSSSGSSRPSLNNDYETSVSDAPSSLRNGGAGRKSDVNRRVSFAASAQVRLFDKLQQSPSLGSASPARTSVPSRRASGSSISSSPAARRTSLSRRRSSLVPPPARNTTPPGSPNGPSSSTNPFAEEESHKPNPEPELSLNDQSVDMELDEDEFSNRGSPLNPFLAPHTSPLPPPRHSSSARPSRARDSDASDMSLVTTYSGRPSMAFTEIEGTPSPTRSSLNPASPVLEPVAANDGGHEIRQPSAGSQEDDMDLSMDQASPPREFTIDLGQHIPRVDTEGNPLSPTPAQKAREAALAALLDTTGAADNEDEDEEEDEGFVTPLRRSSANDLSVSEAIRRMSAASADMDLATDTDMTADHGGGDKEDDYTSSTASADMSLIDPTSATAMEATVNFTAFRKSLANEVSPVLDSPSPKQVDAPAEGQSSSETLPVPSTPSKHVPKNPFLPTNSTPLLPGVRAEHSSGPAPIDPRPTATSTFHSIFSPARASSATKARPISPSKAQANRSRLPQPVFTSSFAPSVNSSNPLRKKRGPTEVPPSPSPVKKRLLNVSVSGAMGVGVPPSPTPRSPARGTDRGRGISLQRGRMSGLGVRRGTLGGQESPLRRMNTSRSGASTNSSVVSPSRDSTSTMDGLGATDQEKEPDSVNAPVITTSLGDTDTRPIERVIPPPTTDAEEGTDMSIDNAHSNSGVVNESSIPKPVRASSSEEVAPQASPPPASSPNAISVQSSLIDPADGRRESMYPVLPPPIPSSSQPLPSTESLYPSLPMPLVSASQPPSTIFSASTSVLPSTFGKAHPPPARARFSLAGRGSGRRSIALPHVPRATFAPTIGDIAEEPSLYPTTPRQPSPALSSSPVPSLPRLSDDQPPRTPSPSSSPTVVTPDEEGGTTPSAQDPPPFDQKLASPAIGTVPPTAQALQSPSPTERQTQVKSPGVSQESTTSTSSMTSVPIPSSSNPLRRRLSFMGGRMSLAHVAAPPTTGPVLTLDPEGSRGGRPTTGPKTSLPPPLQGNKPTTTTAVPAVARRRISLPAAANQGSRRRLSIAPGARRPRTSEVSATAAATVGGNVSQSQPEPEANLPRPDERSVVKPVDETNPNTSISLIVSDTLTNQPPARRPRRSYAPTGAKNGPTGQPRTSLVSSTSMDLTANGPQTTLAPSKEEPRPSISAGQPAIKASRPSTGRLSLVHSTASGAPSRRKSVLGRRSIAPPPRPSLLAPPVDKGDGNTEVDDIVGGPKDTLPHMSLREFLHATDNQLKDDMVVNPSTLYGKSIIASIPTADREATFTLENIVTAELVLNPQLDMYNDCIAKMTSEVAELESECNTLEAFAEETRPAIIREWLTGDDDARSMIKTLTKIRKTYANFDAHGNWYNWRMENLDISLNSALENEDALHKLDETLRALDADLPDPLEEFRADHARLKTELEAEQAMASELEACDPDELQEHAALVEEQLRDLEDGRAALRQATTQLEGIDTTRTELQSQVLDAQTAIDKAISSLEEAQGDTAEEAHRLSRHLEALQRLLSWKLVKLGEKQVVFEFNHQIRVTIPCKAYQPLVADTIITELPLVAGQRPIPAAIQSLMLKLPKRALIRLGKVNGIRDIIDCINSILGSLLRVARQLRLLELFPVELMVTNDFSLEVTARVMLKTVRGRADVIFTFSEELLCDCPERISELQVRTILKYGKTDIEAINELIDRGRQDLGPDSSYGVLLQPCIDLRVAFS